MASMLKTPGIPRLGGGDAPRWGAFNPYQPVGQSDQYGIEHAAQPDRLDHEVVMKALGELVLTPVNQTSPVKVPIITRINA